MNSLSQGKLFLLTSIALLLSAYPVLARGETNIDSGRGVYLKSCVACHGTDGAGAMPGVPDFTDSKEPLSKPDSALLKSIMEGVEGSTAPTPMPPKGGDSEFTEKDARNVIEYIRSEFDPCRTDQRTCSTQRKE